MNDFLPEYRLGESIAGYSARCSSRMRLMRAVPSFQDRLNICREHALQSRDLMMRP